jgi:hypothetical protein
MRKALSVLGFCILFLMYDAAMACSVMVNDNSQKNALAAIAASHLDISLVSVSSTQISGYGKSFGAEDPATHCPQYLNTRATITFAYALSADESCDAQVTVVRSEFIGEALSGPIENIEFLNMTAACSVARRRAERPIRINRPIKPVRR